jgi:hypothetical protein
MMSGLLLVMVLSVCTCWFHNIFTLPTWLFAYHHHHHHHYSLFEDILSMSQGQTSYLRPHSFTEDTLHRNTHSCPDCRLPPRCWLVLRSSGILLGIVW